MVVLPLLDSLKEYRSSWLRHDLVAGFTACVVMIPSVLAYAELVHMPPIAGIYAALASAVGYALFASSRQVIAGPDAAIGLLAGAAILPLAAGNPERIPMLAAILALLSGVVLVLAAQLRVGTIADFLSRPVLVGYLNGASLILAATQLGKLFGIKTSGEDFFLLMWQVISQLGQTHVPTFLLGSGLIAILLILGKVTPRLPGALVVSALAILATVLLGLGEKGVALVGQVPVGVPKFSFPDQMWSDIPALMPAAVAIAFLAFSDGILLAQVFADKNRYEIQPNRELTALGIANISAGLFQGFPVSASQSRTSIVDAAGGRSQLAQLAAAGGLVIFLLFGAELLALLPKVALGAILIVTALGMVEWAALVALYRMDRYECYISITVTLAILVAGVVPGILLGLLVSLIGMIVEISRPGDAVLRRLGPGQKFHDFGTEVGEAESVPGLLVYRPYAPLIFANARHVMNRLRHLTENSDPPVKWVVIDAQAITDMDITAAQRFAELHRELAEDGVEIKIADAPRPLMAQLEKVGLSETLGTQQFYSSVKFAVEDFESMQNPVREIQLLVQEETDEPYVLVFRREGSNMTATCTCEPGEDEELCSHRLAILLGDWDEVNILNANRDELQEILDLMVGTDVEVALNKMVAADKVMQSAQRNYHRSKEQLRQAMHD